VIAIVAFPRHRPGGSWFGWNQPADGRGAVPPTAPVAGPQSSSDFFPGVREQYLRDVQDDTVFRSAERDAWFHLLALLQKSNPADLERASLGRAGYVQLEAQPKEYRGRLVTLDGVVRAAKAVPAPENDLGIERYYQLWLQPDPGSGALVALYALELPGDFPLGERIEALCRAVGFFFKRWAYASRGGVTTAPLVLVRSVQWEPLPAPPPPAPVGQQLLWAFVVALLLAVATLSVVVARSRRAPQRFAVDRQAGDFPAGKLPSEAKRDETAGQDREAQSAIPIEDVR
jgi:hypothetical protein